VVVTSVQGADTISISTATQSAGTPKSVTTVEADLLAGHRPASRRKRAPTRSASKTARLLVADDSAVVRDGLADLLEKEGYEVILAANGQEALDKYTPGMIDLVLLDLDMPIKSGWDVFEEIVARDGSQAIILLTEHLGAVNLAGSGQPSGVAEKPLKPGALLDAVRAALDEPPTTHHYTVEVQQSFARYTRPYDGAWANVESYEHWGLND